MNSDELQAKVNQILEQNPGFNHIQIAQEINRTSGEKPIAPAIVRRLMP